MAEDSGNLIAAAIAWTYYLASLVLFFYLVYFVMIHYFGISLPSL